jgi:hypothetical protein
VAKGTACDLRKSCEVSEKMGLLATPSCLGFGGCNPRLTMACIPQAVLKWKFKGNDL